LPCAGDLLLQAEAVCLQACGGQEGQRLSATLISAPGAVQVGQHGGIDRGNGFPDLVEHVGLAAPVRLRTPIACRPLRLSARPRSRVGSAGEAGTSLLVIAINNAAALAARLGSPAGLDWLLLGLFAVAALAGPV
jgi:hypothetical protein